MIFDLVTQTVTPFSQTQSWAPLGSEAPTFGFQKNMIMLIYIITFILFFFKSQWGWGGVKDGGINISL